MKIAISTTVDALLHQSARDNNISWTDALQFGIQFFVADKEGFGYPDNKLSEKIKKMSATIQQQAEEIERLSNPPENVNPEIAEKEAEEILDNLGVVTNG